MFGKTRYMFTVSSEAWRQPRRFWQRTRSSSLKGKIYDKLKVPQTLSLNWMLFITGYWFGLVITDWSVTLLSLEWVNPSKRGGMDGVFRGLAGLLWGISRGQSPREIPRCLAVTTHQSLIFLFFQFSKSVQLSALGILYYKTVCKFPKDRVNYYSIKCMSWSDSQASLMKYDWIIHCKLYRTMFRCLSHFKVGLI